MPVFPTYPVNLAKNLRLRAAVFINLVHMREAISLKNNNFCTLSITNLQKLQRANYLYHCALNRVSVQKIHDTCVHTGMQASMHCGSQGLADEAINNSQLLWKLRSKLHKWLGCRNCIV